MDCDGDALVVLVDQHGRGACHTGERTCFYRTIGTGPGCPRRDPACGRPVTGPGALELPPGRRPSSPHWPRSTPSSRCGARSWPTPSRRSPCFANVVGDGDGFLFESVEGGERWGRYSFVGRRPLATLTARGRTVETTGRLGLGSLGRRDPGRRRGPAVTASSPRRWPGCRRCTAGWWGISATTWCARSSGCRDPPPDDLGHPDAGARGDRPVLRVRPLAPAHRPHRQRGRARAPDGVVDAEARRRGLRGRLRSGWRSWRRTAPRTGGTGELVAAPRAGPRDGRRQRAR